MLTLTCSACDPKLTSHDSRQLQGSAGWTSRLVDTLAQRLEEMKKA
jgi:hypothetical protein